MNDNIDLMDIIGNKFEDMEVPGFITEVSPIEADMMGAFYEDALNEADAMEAMYD